MWPFSSKKTNYRFYHYMSSTEEAELVRRLFPNWTDKDIRDSHFVDDDNKSKYMIRIKAFEDFFHKNPRKYREFSFKDKQAQKAVFQLLNNYSQINPHVAIGYKNDNYDPLLPTLEVAYDIIMIGTIFNSLDTKYKLYTSFRTCDILEVSGYLPEMHIVCKNLKIDFYKTEVIIKPV